MIIHLDEDNENVCIYTRKKLKEISKKHKIPIMKKIIFKNAVLYLQKSDIELYDQIRNLEIKENKTILNENQL